jgi:hypothetical protein
MPFKKTPKPLKTKNSRSPSLSQELIAEQNEEQFWEEVDQLAQAKIYQLLTQNLPLPNLKLITESYTGEDKQQKLTGLFLHKDADYRSLLLDIEGQYSEENEEEENLPDQEYLAQEIALWYYRLFIKALISDLSEYTNYDSSYFESLTE